MVGTERASRRVAEATHGPPTVRQLFDEQGAFVLRTIRRLGVRASDVEDALQDVFVVVHRNLPRYDGVSPVRGWLFGIASRVAADYRKRAHVRREHVTDRPPDGVVVADQGDGIERAEARELLDHALDRLDDAQRSVFVLYELEGLAMPEVASIVGCPAQTAYSRLHAARDRIRAFVEAATRKDVGA